MSRCELIKKLMNKKLRIENSIISTRHAVKVCVCVCLHIWNNYNVINYLDKTHCKSVWMDIYICSKY